MMSHKNQNAVEGSTHGDEFFLNIKITLQIFAALTVSTTAEK